MDQGAVPAAGGALANDYPLVKEPKFAFVSLYPLTLCDHKEPASALAARPLFAQRFSASPGEAKDTIYGTTLRTSAQNRTLEIALAGTGVVHDGWLRRN
jgi:hypothetical protein